MTIFIGYLIRIIIFEQPNLRFQGLGTNDLSHPLAQKNAISNDCMVSFLRHRIIFQWYKKLRQKLDILIQMRTYVLTNKAGLLQSASPLHHTKPKRKPQTDL